VELCILYCALIFPRCLCESCTFYRPLLSSYLPQWHTRSTYLETKWVPKRLIHETACLHLIEKLPKERKLKACHQNLYAIPDERELPGNLCWKC
jgi:hypothetical protein